MATNTVTQTQELTPEQKALAQIQLEQIKRRQGFEDFAGNILLGKPLSSLSGSTGGTGLGPVLTGVPSGSNPVSSTVGASGGAGAAVSNPSIGSAVGSIASLNNLAGNTAGAVTSSNSGPNVSGPSVLDSIGKALSNVNPGLVGSLVGGASLGLGGIGIGKTVGDSIGTLLNGNSTPASVITPEMNADVSNQINQQNQQTLAQNQAQIVADTQKGIDALTPEQIRNQANAPSSNPLYHAPTQGQISAGRAAQTAQDGLQFLAQSYGATQDLLNAMSGGGNSGPPEWARQKMQGEAVFNNRLAPALIYAGYTPTQIKDIYMRYIGGYGTGVNNDIPEIAAAMQKYMTRPGANTTLQTPSANKAVK